VASGSTAPRRGLAEILFEQGHLDLAIEAARRAHDVLSGDEPDAAFALVTGQFGRFLALASEDDANPVIEEALRLAQQLELPEVYSQALSSRAVAIGREGRLDEAVTVLRRALEIAIVGDFTSGGSFVPGTTWPCTSSTRTTTQRTSS